MLLVQWFKTTCLQRARTLISQLNPSCFCDASAAMSPNCICFLSVCRVFKACNVSNRRCKYCLLCICNILNLCNAGSALTIQKKAFWQYSHKNGYVFPDILHIYFVCPYVLHSFDTKFPTFIVPTSGYWYIMFHYTVKMCTSTYTKRYIINRVKERE